VLVDEQDSSMLLAAEMCLTGWLVVVKSEVDQLQIAPLELQPSPVLMGRFPDGYLQGSNDEIRLAAILVCMMYAKVNK